MPFKKKPAVFVSDLDELLASHQKNHAFTASQQYEYDRCRKVTQLRDQKKPAS